MRVLVTGASPGIGGATCRKLANTAKQKGEKLQIAACEISLTDDLKALGIEVERLGAEIVILTGDLSEPGCPARLVEEAIRAFGGLDAVVSNAGVTSPAPLKDLSIYKWDKLLNWTQNEFNLDFKIINGIMPVEQPKENYITFFNEIEKLDCISLTALSDIVTLSGSLILGLLLLKKKIISKQAWSLAKVDEEWQRSKWGTLPEQVEEDEYKKNKFFIACKLISLLN